ncbi:Gfo/Idh/MocA family oxidoreductase (plasmid) [Paraburkholderia sprentiae WSM5005]|uniref:Gfo/Idh/MocA family oxidoreductase n=1 Tax=Paraburkholderia sprentiae WSM5005 TaxID=754502 RepID=A0A1I9YU43_9BURK|nr:Gfo/Idh/MocA family oxidoreductase [Paraburkholderia sprentiae]APA89711.1 Gfo/Idh/MocA family oxidoreductase [Paraburkholderia sprentiae WSM5005]
MSGAGTNTHSNGAQTVFKGALIGCGFFSRNHLHAWREIGEARIVALCDADQTRLQAAGREFGIERLYSDAAAMLAAEQLDFVDIATTVASHKALVELAARAKLAVICQKPFARSLDDARAMVDACHEAGVALMVHENFRWQSAIQSVGAALHRGEIGEPFWGRVSFRSGFDVFSGQPYLAEGERFIVEDLGIHVLDIARFLFGDVKRLYASTSRVNPAIRGEDVATIMLSHEQRVTCIVDCSYATRLPRELFPQTLVEVDGSAGTLRLFADYRLQIHTAAGTEMRDVAPPPLSWASAPWEAIQGSVASIQSHWIDCLRRGVEPATSGRDNLATLALVEATYVSARERRSIEMTEMHGAAAKEAQ